MVFDQENPSFGSQKNPDGDSGYFRLFENNFAFMIMYTA